MISFWAKHKVGILATVIFHFAVLLYFNTTEMELPIREERNIVLIELDYTEEEIIEENEAIKEESLEEIPTEEDVNEKIQNLMRDAQDRRAKSTKNFSEKSIEEELEAKYKKLEQDIIKKRQEEGKGFDASKYEIKKNNNDQNESNNNTAEAENQVSGKVTTECDIPGRNCRAKTPAYRCPAGGKIHIDIKVNQKGKVIAANVNPIKSTSTNACLISEAIKYAKRSTANQDFNAPNAQSGYVIYNFISQ